MQAGVKNELEAVASEAIYSINSSKEEAYAAHRIAEVHCQKQKISRNAEQEADHPDFTEPKPSPAKKALPTTYDGPTSITPQPLDEVRHLRVTPANPKTSSNGRIDFERCDALHNAIVTHA